MRGLDGFSSSSTFDFIRYVDDQVTHARIELVARIFRSKHGPLSQRLRYTYHQEQGTVPSTFDSVFKNASFLPSNLIPQDYLQDAKPDRLIDEFLMLNKQLQEQKNPDLGRFVARASLTTTFVLPFAQLRRTRRSPREFIILNSILFSTVSIRIPR